MKLIKIYIYTSGQTNDACPLSGRAISKNLTELLYAIECHKDSLEEQIIPTYVLITAHLLQYLKVFNLTSNYGIFTIMPNGNIVELEPSEMSSGDIANQYMESVKEVNSKDIKSYGIGPRMKIVSAYIQWHQGCYIEDLGDTISDDMETFIKESRVEDTVAEVRTDLDAVSLIMKNGDLTRDDIIAIKFRDKLLDKKDIDDFFTMLGKVILPVDGVKPFIAPATEIYINEIEDFRYEIQFSDKSTIERDYDESGETDIFIGECDETTMSDL